MDSHFLFLEVATLQFVRSVNRMTMGNGWAVIAVDNSSMPAVWEWTLPPHSVKLLHNAVQISLSKPLATMCEKRIQCSDCDLFSKLPMVLFLFVWFIFKVCLIPLYKP